MDNQPTHSHEASGDISKCPFHNGSLKMGGQGGNGTGNQDWWPHQLKLKNISGKPNSQLAIVSVQDSTIVLVDKNIETGKVPDVIGMGASNAIFLMENAGLKVKVKGRRFLCLTKLTPLK